MAKFLSKLFSRGSSFSGSQTSFNDSATRSKLSNSARTSSSLENLSSYHVLPKDLEKNKLHKASWEGNLNKVKHLARPGQINLKDQQMRTPLHLAVVKGHIEIVNYLVQENAKLDVVDNDQRTPLIKAVLSGNQNPRLNYQICQVLVEGGAGTYINAVDNNGKSALHYAIDFGNQDLVALFLSTDNCDPNLHDRDQMTPLHLAIKRNSPAIVQLLLSDQRDQQADPNIGNRYGQTPLHLAASVGYIDIVRLLLLSNLNEPCDPTILDSQQQTAYELAKNNHQEACTKLIQEYQEKHYKEPLRRLTTTSLHEQSSIRATNSISMTPAANLQHDQDETSEDSSSVTTSKPSKSSPRRMKRPSDQWSDDYNPSPHTIASLFKANPLQTAAMNKDSLSALDSLLNNNPLQTKPKKTTATSQQARSTSFFGIGPVIERMDSENTSTSMSAEKSVKPTAQNKPVLSKLVSDTKSWSDDTTTASPTKKQEPKMNSWDTSTSDDDLSAPKPNQTLNNLVTTQPFSPSTQNLTSSDTDDNSVETEIRKLDPKKPSTLSIDTLVNKQLGQSYKEVQSPVSDDSSWTTSAVPFSQALPTQVILPPKEDDSTWDDSRPLTSDSHGVDNLVQMMDKIIHAEKKQTPPKVIGKLITSSMIDPNDSLKSDYLSHRVDDIDEKSWKKKSDDRSVTVSHDKQNLPRASLPYDTHSVRASVSSTRSSFNEAQLNELRENIKQLERNQEDARELRRQLREMEEKKNNFERLYKENDQTLRNIESKLNHEKDEKQRLESTTDNLHQQLNNVKLKLQQIEFEKEFLNQRCTQLEQQRQTVEEILPSPPTVQQSKELHTEFDDLPKPDHRYRTDLEKAIEEKAFFQRELDRLKAERDLIEQEKLVYKAKYDSLHEEIRAILSDRSKLERKLTEELQEHFEEKQRSTNDIQKYRNEIDELNMKLSDAQARLADLQIRKEVSSKEKRFNLTDPLTVQTGLPANHQTQQQRAFNRSYDLNSTVPQPYTGESYLLENSRVIRSNTERVKSELDRLREDFDRLVSNYEPNNKLEQHTQIHSQIDTFRQFYEDEFRQRQLLMSKMKSDTHPMDERRASLRTVDHSLNVTSPYPSSSTNHHRRPSIPRQASALLTINTASNGVMSSIDLVRKHYRA